MFYNNYYPYNNYKIPKYKKINFASVLDSTQKTLSVINQAIPIIYQIKPIYNNAKTIFKVANAIKDDNKEVNINKTTSKKVEPNNSPTYFL